MSNRMHVTELLPAYALGSLDEEEARQAAAHLAACPSCRAEFEPYAAVVDRLALAAPDAAPPSGLKERILGQLQTPHTGPATEPRRPWWQRLADLFRRPALAWGTASLILVGLLVLTNLWRWQQAPGQGRAAHPADMQTVALAATGAAPGASGILIISGDGEYGTLVVDGLPALDADHQYQLWLIRDGQRTSGGVFTVNPEGYGSLPVGSPEPLSSYPAFGITVEPAGGSPGPTGEKVLGAGP
jgi:anti-sigma-K factor RskA